MGGVALDGAALGGALGGAALDVAAWVAAAACCLIGALIGYGGRFWLARLRRGAIVRAGVLEVAGAAVGALSGLLLWPSALILPGLWVGGLMVVLSAVDLKHHRLPDAITLPAIPLSAVFVTLTWIRDPLSGNLLRALIAALVVGSIFFGIAALAPAAMGRGDAKLVLSLGLLMGYVSWPAVIIGMALAFVLGGLAGLLGMVFGRMKLRSALPFGPFLLVATWVVVIWPDLPQFLVR